MTHVDEPDELLELLADARALLDAELSASSPPDVLDVVQRARELSLAEPDLELAELNADACLLLDALLVDASLERRGTLRRRRWRHQPRAAAVAAAAVVLLGLAGAAFASKRWQELQSAATSQRFAAAAVAELDRAWVVESKRSSALWLPAWTVPLTAVQNPPPAHTSGAASPPTPIQATAKPDTATHLAELDAQAYALLRAGQHEQAARQFRTIVEIGGRSEYAELAFGELFALARRDSLAHELDELWSAYLKRFPRGRYADAARAGLCRRTVEPNKATCWTDYLLEHPRGAARSEALRESQDG
jgi:hypothetical protein